MQQCAAIKKNGERCSNEAIPGSKFCYIHQHVASPRHSLVSPTRRSLISPTPRVYKKPSLMETEQKILVKTYDYYMSRLSNKPPKKFRLVAMDLNIAAKAIAQGDVELAVRTLTHIYEIGHAYKLIDNRITYPGPHDFKKLAYHLETPP